MIRYPSLDAVVLLNEQQTGTAGLLRDPASLAATLDRPRAGFGGHEAYPTLVEKAAVLLHGLASTQPFLDGNKRTAWVTTAAFLRTNGAVIATVPPVQAEALTLAAATNLLSVERVGEWIWSHVDPRRTFRNVEIQVHELLGGPDGALEDAILTNCDIVGPAVLHLATEVRLIGGSFIGPHDPSDLVWELPADGTGGFRQGMINVHRTEFYDCRFHFVGFAGMLDELQPLLAVPMSPPGTPGRGQPGRTTPAQ